MNNLMAGLVLLIASSAHSQELGFSYGLGVFNSAKLSAVEVKVVNLAYRYEILNGLYWQAKVGYWGDGSGNPTRKGSFYASTGLGMKLDFRPIEFRSGWSLAGISQTDGYLGGNFPQFNGEIYVGVRDKKGNGAGIKYEHISSAGYFAQNVGRDFILLEMSKLW
ncbi:MAG: acyloxyacyl hydrolase [Candidatus Methanoperedens sp.]|nr:acyloxyacyl hydrolase [Candidatus Methanoperedens sp.]